MSKKNLSTDVDVVNDYFNDPLVFRSMTARYGREAINTQNFVNENIHNYLNLAHYIIFFHMVSYQNQNFDFHLNQVDNLFLLIFLICQYINIRYIKNKPLLSH